MDDMIVKSPGEPPCYRCDGHNAECHASCSSYLNWSDENQKYKAYIQKQKYVDLYYNMKAPGQTLRDIERKR